MTQEDGKAVIDVNAMLMERNEILRTLDVVRARALLPTIKRDAIVLVALHKARYECMDIQRDLRFESGEWLRMRGLKRMTGQELLPPDWLPGDNPRGEEIYYYFLRGFKITGGQR